jgi:hypothetical protein
MFGSKRDRVKGGGRKQQNEELHNLYFSPNIMSVIEIKEDDTGEPRGKYGMEEYYINL